MCQPNYMAKRPPVPKSLFFVLLTILMLQSCKVYEGHYVTEDDAVSSAQRVKVETVDGKTYKFKQLFKEGDQLVGLAKPNSLAVKEMPSRIIQDTLGHKDQKIALERENIKEIHMLDPKKSKRRTVGLVVAVTLGMVWLVAMAAITVTSVSLLSY